MALDPYKRVSWRGVTVNQRTQEMVQITEKRALASLTPMAIPQGSYNPGGVSQSGGTHDGGGAVDISVRDMTFAQRQTVVRELRETGFAAWLRTPAQGFVYHIHAIAIGDKELSPTAKQQVIWYKQGLNGLWGDAQGPDDGPKVSWTEYRQDIDMSYYGFENFDSRDWARYREVLLATEVGEVTLPDGRVVKPNLGQCMRAAYWLRFQLGSAEGYEELAKQLFGQDGVFRNQSAPETLPDGSPNPAARGPLTWFISDLEATQDADHAALAEVQADVAAIKAAVVTNPPA